jgi:ferrous iron transport protein A
MKTKVSLLNMKKNETGKVIDYEGGHGFSKKLEDMGIRKGVKIRKVSQQLLKGPAVIKTGHTRVGIGHTMAKKIIVEVERDK